MRRLVARLLAPMNTSFIIVLGIGQMLIGFWLALPFDSWADYAPTPIPESVIGISLFVISGFITLFSILVNLAALQWATTLGYLFWLVTMVVMLIVHAAGTGWISSLIFMIFCFMISLNIKVNRRYLK